MAPFVLEGKAAALPDIGPAVSPTLLCRAALEAEGVTRRITLRRLRMTGQLTEIEEMLLVGGTLRERDPRPFGDELGGGNGHDRRNQVLYMKKCVDNPSTKPINSSSIPELLARPLLGIR